MGGYRSKKSIGGINIKHLLTKQLHMALLEEHHEFPKKRQVSQTSNKELKRVVSDLMKLRKIALKMQSTERKLLFYALLIALATAFMENGVVEKIWKEATRNE